MKVISFGAGVNSIAMTIMLFKRGEIYPVVFADTMAEHPETYCYMDYFEKEFMSKYKQKIIKINPIITSEYYTKYNSKSLEQYCIDKKIIPFVTSNRYCSKGWKIEPFNKYIKKHCLDKKTNMAIKLIGFSYDEKHRAKNNQNDLYVVEKYPLIESGIGRRQCLDIIKNEGLNLPKKSRCFFCPYQEKEAWKNLYFNYPELFKRAIVLEEIATSKNNIITTLLPSGIRLRYLKETFQNQTDIFPDWNFEELEPCICKL